MNKPPLPELRLFITDTLGNPFIEEEQLGQTYEPIAVSRRRANKVKKDERITVVIGNPPYKNQASVPLLTDDSQIGANLQVCADEEDRADFDRRG